LFPGSGSRIEEVVRMRRYLVVANRTVGGDHLVEHMQMLAAADPDDPAVFDVVVPATPTSHSGGWTEGESARAAQDRLAAALERFAAEGLQASGTIGDANPVLAVLDASRDVTYQQIVVSTLPAGPSRWLRRDLPNRVARAVDVPVAHIVAAPAPAVH
jgi:GABA permease